MFLSYELYERRGPSASRNFFIADRCDAFIRVFDIYLFICPSVKDARKFSPTVSITECLEKVKTISINFVETLCLAENAIVANANRFVASPSTLVAFDLCLTVHHQCR